MMKILAFASLYLCAVFSLQAQITGIGTPKMDVIIPVEETFLEKLPGNKSGNEITSSDVFETIIDYGKHHDMVIKSGGSCSNTLKGIASLGTPCTLLGKIGRDEMAHSFMNAILPYGITPRFIECDSPTGVIACMITPDGERTMRTLPGASVEFTGSDISLDDFSPNDFVHIEGYAFYNDDLVVKACEYAKKKGAIVSLDLGCYEIASEYRETIFSLISESVDILFANETEAYHLTGCKDPSRSCRTLSQICPLVVVMAGSSGCYVGENRQITHVPTTAKKATDAVGAGDLFIGGFLYGHTKGYSRTLSCKIGNILGGCVIDHPGAEIPLEVWPQIRNQVKTLETAEGI